MAQFFSIQDIGAIGPELYLAMFGMILLILDLIVEKKRTLGFVALIGIGVLRVVPAPAARCGVFSLRRLAGHRSFLGIFQTGLPDCGRPLDCALSEISRHRTGKSWRVLRAHSVSQRWA